MHAFRTKTIDRRRGFHRVGFRQDVRRLIHNARAFLVLRLTMRCGFEDQYETRSPGWRRCVSPSTVTSSSPSRTNPYSNPECVIGSALLALPRDNALSVFFKPRAG